MAICAECGATVKDGVFCSECGKALNAPQGAAAEPAQATGAVQPNYSQNKYAAYAAPSGAPPAAAAAPPPAPSAPPVSNPQNPYAVYSQPAAQGGQQVYQAPPYQQPYQGYQAPQNTYGPGAKHGVAPVLGLWSYVGAILLFAVPLVGLIFAIVWACGGHHNKNLVNFARAHLVLIALAVLLYLFLILLAVLGLSVFSGLIGSSYNHYLAAAVPLALNLL